MYHTPTFYFKCSSDLSSRVQTNIQGYSSTYPVPAKSFRLNRCINSSVRPKYSTGVALVTVIANKGMFMFLITDVVSVWIALILGIAIAGGVVALGRSVGR